MAKTPSRFISIPEDELGPYGDHQINAIAQQAQHYDRPRMHTEAEARHHLPTLRECQETDTRLASSTRSPKSRSKE